MTSCSWQRSEESVLIMWTRAQSLESTHALTSNKSDQDSHGPNIHERSDNAAKKHQLPSCADPIMDEYKEVLVRSTKIIKKYTSFLIFNLYKKMTVCLDC